MNELISIIMPVRRPNVEQFTLAVNSILNQTYPNMEFLILYKKSDEILDEKIKEIINKYKNDNRLKFIISNKGYVERLNEGIALSKGSIIGRMDADDISVKNRFEEQVKYLRDNDFSILGSWVNSISTNGKIIGTIEPPFEPNAIRGKIMYHSPISHSSIIIDKKLLIDIGGYDSNFLGAEDYELYLRTISKGYKIANIPKYLIHIREEETSFMRSSSNWKNSRKAYFCAKTKAVSKYGFRRFTDLIFWIITPVSFLINPKTAYFMKKNIGWYKNSN
jgi:glycosyltransferase involved in cell wall biosynthesis